MEFNPNEFVSNLNNRSAELNSLLSNLLNAENLDDFTNALFKYVIHRLELPINTQEKNISLLVLYSVRLKMPDEDISTLESRLSTIDCHQTTYLVSKKTLLMMEIEKALKVSLSDSEINSSIDIESYAKNLFKAYKCL